MRITSENILVKLFVLVNCFLLVTVLHASAQMDTLYHLGSKPSKGDSITYTDILHKFTWNVTCKDKDGTQRNSTTTRPDTLTTSNNLDTLKLSTSVFIAPQLVNRVIALDYKLEGSVLVQMNRSVILATGAFRKNKQGKRATLIDQGYKSFLFNDTVQRIEIVYTPYPETKAFDLGLYVCETDRAERINSDRVAKISELYREGFYYLAFAIVFMLMFLFFKEKRENLYFSLFCLFAALGFLSKIFGLELLYNERFLFNVLSLEFMSIFVYKILRNKEKPKISLVVVCAIIAISFLPAIRYSGANVMGQLIPGPIIITYTALYVYTFGSVLLLLIQGIGQKQWEARVIIWVCLIPVFILFVLFVTFSIVNYRSKFADIDNSFFAEIVFNYFTSAIIYVYPLSAVFILGRRNGLNQVKLMAQVISIKQLSAENLAREQEKKQILEGQKAELEKEVSMRTAQVVAQKEELQKQHAELVVEKGKSDDLLRNILPEEVMEELKSTGISEAKLFDNVTVLFADFVDFTKAGENMTPKELVSELHICFKAYDEIISKYGIEKIKTIGDAYLAVAGLPVGNVAHAQNIVQAAIEIRKFMDERYTQLGNRTFRVRIGVHSGSVVAGIVGVKKFAYDIWGDTVNTAARMEQNSEAGKINISETTYELVKDSFTCEYRGKIEAKNKGMMNMYFVLGVGS